MPINDDSLFEILRGWRAAGKPAALATVVSTWGSSPRPEGSHLAVDGDGHFLGSVSGGCIEGAVIEAAGRPAQMGLVALWNVWAAMRYRASIPQGTFEMLVKPWITVVGPLPEA